MTSREHPRTAAIFFGGSFDPIHNGHLFMAAEAAAVTGMRPVLFVPTGTNPLKREGAILSASDRYQMVCRAVADADDFLVSDFEIRAQAGAVNYTVNTISALIARGDLIERPGLLIGDDILPELGRWHDVERLFRMVRPVIVRRNQLDNRLDRPAESERVAASTVLLPEDTVYVDNVRVPISSTAVRERLARGESVRYLVPEAVWTYLEERRRDE